MRIRLSSHTETRATERGTNEKEIRDIFYSGYPIPAKYGHLGKAKIFDFHEKRHGECFAQKRAEIFYVEENDDIIILTVYVFYGKWE